MFAEDSISTQIWDLKYRHATDKTVEDTWRRVAKALAQPEQDRDKWEAEFYECIKDYKFVPAGRILSNAGTDRAKTTLFNCFVLPIADSMESIFETVKNSSIVQKYGGGIGINISRLRPAGAYVAGAEASSSGPISFLKVFSAANETVMSAGQRRSAMIALMDCDHPDIEAFIDAKRDGASLQNFNLSVAITAAFMDAVKKGSDWELRFGGKVYRTVKAVDLWNRIIQSTYDFAEPGVFFIDRVNKMNNLRYCETIEAANPCVTGDTLIATEQGPVPMRQLAEAGRDVPVKSLNVDTGKMEIKMGRWPRKTGQGMPICKIALKGDMSIRATPGHGFFVHCQEHGGVIKTEAICLRPGDRLVGMDDPELFVKSGWVSEFVVQGVEMCGAEDVYNITVEHNHNYFVMPALHGVVSQGACVANCGEQPLPQNNACLLGSVNLARFVKDEFAENAKVDYDGIKKSVRTAVRMLDNVIDISRYPLQEIEIEVKQKRRLGIGIFGLADMFAMLRVKYGCEESLEIADKCMKAIAETAYEASVELAKEKGRFPAFDADKYMESEFVKRMPKHVRDAIREHGMRNSHLTSIAPTGTISLFSGNVSSGLEPIFAISYTRKYKVDGADKEQVVADYAAMLYMQKHGKDSVPSYFVTTADIKVAQHIAVQSALQKWVDSSISKTINTPEDISFDDFKDVYMKAYDAGLKGCTTYRPNPNLKSILSHSRSRRTVKRPEVLDVDIHHFQSGGSKWTAFVGRHNGGPFEIFAGLSAEISVPAKYSAAHIVKREMKVSQSKYDLYVNRGTDDEMVVKNITGQFKNELHGSVTRFMSMCMRHGVPVVEIYEQMERSMPPEMDSLYRGLMRVLKRYIPDDTQAHSSCPSCQATLVYKDGCKTCMECGWTACS